MEKFKNLMKTFVRDDEGAIMAEYAVVLVVIALATIAAFATLSTDIAAALGRASAILTGVAG